MAMLADYEEAAAQGQGHAWQLRNGIWPSQPVQWRELRKKLVRQFQEAVARGEADEWLMKEKLTQARMEHSLAKVRARQSMPPPTMPAGPEGEISVEPAVDLGPLMTASDHGTAAAASASTPGSIEVDHAQVLTADDVAPADREQIRRSDVEKLALLADYEQANAEKKAKEWLKENNFDKRRPFEWRRLRTKLFGEYQEAFVRGEADAWLRRKGLTQAWMEQSQAAIRAGQPMPKPVAPAGHGTRKEILVDSVADFGLLAAAAHHGAAADQGTSASPPGPIEIDPAQALTLDDLPSGRRGRTLRSDEEKLALLADYEQAAAQRKGNAWLREFHISARLTFTWRQLREDLVGEFQEAVSQGEADAWLRRRKLTRARMEHAQAVIRARQPIP
ncbi:MAG TPA: hypothetical protein VFP72_18955 [Kineosporiaceae bacterium]|nr:hypothetical protein [Kineosporiaceae bacterium]